MMTSEALRGLARDALGDRLLLRASERTAAGYPPALRARMAELFLAGRSRARAADLLVEGNVPSALALYREAALLTIAAYVTIKSGEAVTEPFPTRDLLAHFRTLEPGSPPGDPARFEAFLASLGGGELLDADRLGSVAAIEQGNAARDAVAWLGRLIEPRTVSEIRLTRAARLGALTIAFGLLLAWSVSSFGSRPNLALHKPVTVSGVHPAALSPPSGLTDGVTSGSYGVHTSSSDAPWVQVDLEAVYVITSVKVYNRGDGWFDDGLPMTLQLSENGRDFVDVATRTTTFSQTFPWVAKTGRRRARYIRVRGASGRYVTLSELEAFGEKK